MIRPAALDGKFRMNRLKFAIGAISIVCSGNALAQESSKGPVAILELGGASSWTLKDSRQSLSPTLAAEVTPVENWLELEMGVTPAFGRHSTEWDTDFLFKKPWDISKTVEFMLGVGPVWVHRREYGITTNLLAGEVALDFMFWPSARRKLGWYIEPGYQYTLGPGHDRSLGISAGLLIAIPRRH